MNTVLRDAPKLGSSQRRARLDALERLANIDPLDLCSEAKVEKCRAIRELRSCGRVVQHVLTSCGHASLCTECSQRCDVCPICRVPVPKHDGSRQLRLYNECLEAGLISRKADENFMESKGDGQCWTEDVQHLYSLFDVALENNLISLVCHYVTDVCMDESAVSSDAIVAMLLDGGVVKDWSKRTLLNVISSLPELYNLGVQSDVFSKYTTQLDAIVNVLEVLEGSLLDLPSPQLLELQHLLETASKVKQHLEVMAWCARHSFLEGVQCRYMGISHWRSVFHERKDAASERAWPDYSNNTSLSVSQSQATLFIEDALANLSIGQDYDGELGKEAYELSWLRQGGNLSQLPFKDGLDRPAYPPENLRAAVDLLFLEGSSGLILAKRAIFLYYLFDRHWNVPNTDWRNIVDDYAGTFGITRNLVLESLVFYLLDDNTEEALEEACRLLPEIVSPTIHPKVARVLLERQNPDAALMVLRCSGHDGQFGITDSGFQRAGVVALPEAVTAVRVRLECGLLTEAYLYQKTHCQRVRAEQTKHRQMTAGVRGAEDMIGCRDWLTEMEILVGEICWLCIRRKLVDRMIELPWHSNEEKFLQKCLLERTGQDPSSSAGNLLVVFFIQRCRYPEAYQIHKRLCDLEQQSISQSIDKKMVERIEIACEWRTRLIEKCIELLPEIQRRDLRSGNISECPVSPLTGEQYQPFDMEIEQTIFSAVSNPSASILPPSVGQQPFDGRKSELIQNSSINSDDIPSATTLGLGDNCQPCILHVKPFRHIAGSSSFNPRLDSSRLLNGQAKQKDQEKPGVSPIRSRILNDDFESGKSLHENESSEQHYFLSNYTPSQEEGNVEKDVAYRIQSKGLFSDSSTETRGLEVLIRTQNGSGSSKQNGHSISGAVSLVKDREQVSLENGVHIRDLPTTSSFDAPRSRIVMSQERLSVSTRTDLDVSGLPISGPGSSGKRLPSDRSWLASPSDDDFWRGKGGGTVPSFSSNAKNQDVSPYSQADSYQSTNSGVESQKANGSVRWRSDEGEEEDDPRPKRAGRLKGSSGTKGKGIGRSRFYPSRIP